MIGPLKKLFGPAAAPCNEEIDATEDAGLWQEHKSILMEEMLGARHPHVGHALIPFALGGCLNAYYYPHGIPGTGIATQQLSEIAGAGPSNRDLSCYELVMFTRLPLSLAEAENESTPFGKMHERLRHILIPVARYSGLAELNSLETMVLPPDMKRVGGACLIFHEYARRGDELVNDFGLLAGIEIFPRELDFAKANGGERLIELLKSAGHYPYSDLDREPVV